MKILWLIHGYPPVHNAGAEFMAHAMNKMFLARGHEVRVMFQAANYETEFEGVEVGDLRNNNLRESWVRWADRIFTHLDCQGYAADIARQKQKQLVVIVHNTYRDELYHPRFAQNWIILNTNWIKEEKKYEDFKSEKYHCTGSRKTIVVHPPVIEADYKVKPDGKYYTLVNMNENKGGKLFLEVAEEMPDIDFLGVTGSYATQFTKKLPNLKIIPNVPDIKQALKKTKCLMCLSTYESFGRAGLEAMVSGIPVISTRTKGTLEAYGDAALFTDRNVPSIIEAIETMEKEHSKWSKLARKQYESWDFDKEIDELLIWLQ